MVVRVTTRATNASRHEVNEDVSVIVLAAVASAMQRRVGCRGEQMDSRWRLAGEWHVKLLDDFQLRDINLWYPSGTIVTVPTGQGLRDVEDGYVVR